MPTNASAAWMASAIAPPKPMPVAKRRWPAMLASTIATLMTPSGMPVTMPRPMPRAAAMTRFTSRGLAFFVPRDRAFVGVLRRVDVDVDHLRLAAWANCFDFVRARLERDTRQRRFADELVVD